MLRLTSAFSRAKGTFFRKGPTLVRSHASAGHAAPTELQHLAALQQKLRTGPVLLYQETDPTFRRLLLGAAVAQGIFWVNIGTMAYQYLSEIDPETKEKVPAPWRKRVTYLGGMCLVGAVFAGGMAVYASKFVASATLQKEGRSLAIKYYPTPLSQGRVKEVPVERVFTRSRLYTGQGEDGAGASKRFFFIGERKQLFSWALDRSGAWDPVAVRAWDTLFYRPRNKTETPGLVVAGYEDVEEVVPTPKMLRRRGRRY